MNGPDHAAIVDNLTTAIAVLDQDLRFVFLNPAAEELLGTSLRHAMGKHFDEVLPLASTIREHLESCLESRLVRAEREIELPLGPSHPVIVDLILSPLGPDEGHPTALLLEMNCRPGRQAQHEEAIRQHQHQLSRLLARGLAHEIRNPLGGLRGAAQLLASETQDDVLHEYTAIILAETDRLTGLIDRLLGPRQGPKPEWTNIHEPLEHVRSLVTAEGHADLIIETDYDPSLPDIEIDPDQLVQALLNLVLNAVQAMQGEGRILLRTRSQRQVTIGERCHRLVARIDIVDSGPGIPEAIAEDIFLPMISGRADGSGLGLPIAQTLVQQNGGIIECQSRPGQTVFTIFLPIGRDD